mmetsp:Transcript_27737/g.73254  ORF Transcript_27737/g.73254 Transcript_27737/m.73254 type:complete len:190 (+) Transcript_27737:54-623(+)|eukprot:CAMPEP_0113695470 /NCGR_PEP_ID=MMETSP0038_2-20120614/20923_1 /TAXON_ID=2898 /ORGANISM="Cryptomonas paramecium" /LENGTH=189 /DNA_ID=CAMNT_0000618027 /DNA_START=53 /DNA_END=622 /DNA_ORIENTATION=+ /assembly_acc=CAM_ASM_000170
MGKEGSERLQETAEAPVECERETDVVTAGETEEVTCPRTILQMFDPSVIEHYERCSTNEWVGEDGVVHSNSAGGFGSAGGSTPTTSVNSDIRRRSDERLVKLLKSSKKLRNVAKKLVSLKINQKNRRKKTKRATHSNSGLEINQGVGSQILNGCNTPAGSRPCSMSISAEFVEEMCSKRMVADLGSAVC